MLALCAGKRLNRTRGAESLNPIRGAEPRTGGLRGVVPPV